MAIRYDAATLARWRKHIMERGRTLSTLLSEVMAGKNPPGVAALLAAKPGKRPEEVLRLAISEVEARRKLIDAGDDAFGRCDVCGKDLGEAELGEMPWADRCREHATQ